MVQKNRKPSSVKTVSALILREMATTYGRSPGGYVWALLEPLAGIALLSVAFGLLLRSPGLGTNFPLFYATGYLPFMMYMDISRKVMASITFSKPLLMYPAVTIVDALLARFILNFLTHILVMFIVFAGIFILYDTKTILDFRMITLAVMLVGLLAFSIGVINCFLISQFPIWRTIWNILNRPLFFLSCIFYTFENLPQVYQNFLWYNPLVHIVGIMRKGFYSTYDASFSSGLFVTTFSLIILSIGLLYLVRFYRQILYQVGK